MDCQLQTASLANNDLGVDPGWNSEGFPPLANDVPFPVHGPGALQPAPSMLDEKLE